MFKKTATVLLIATLSVTSAHAGWADQCFLFTKDDYRGATFTMSENTAVADFGARKGWNDEISSVDVDGTCTLSVYYDSHFRGAMWMIGNNKKAPELGMFNDEISSAKCECY